MYYISSITLAIYLLIGIVWAVRIGLKIFNDEINEWSFVQFFLAMVTIITA